MSAQHFFVTGTAAPEPARWRDAFPRGQALPLAKLLRDKSAGAGLIWLHSADAQWSACLAQILEALPQARVVLLSNAPQASEGLMALNAGVRGYSHAYAVPALLQEVALVLEHGGLWVGPELLQRLVGSTHSALERSSAAAVSPLPSSAAAKAWATLSARESEVARFVSTGRSNKEVAAQMFISERTVKAHLGAVFEKLGVRDRLQLVLSLSALDNAAATHPAKAPP